MSRLEAGCVARMIEHRDEFPLEESCRHAVAALECGVEAWRGY